MLNQKDREGNTPLLTAIGGRSIDIIRRLVQEEIVDINSGDNEDRSPMQWAAFRGNLEAVKCLLERKDIRPDEPGFNGMQQVEREERDFLLIHHFRADTSLCCCRERKREHSGGASQGQQSGHQ